jgi:Fe-S-cluster containining protein
MFRYILKAEGRWDADKAQYYPIRRIYKLRGKCPFLIEHEDGTTSCKIYSFRPMVCKMFPLSNECPTTRKINKTENSDE